MTPNAPISVVSADWRLLKTHQETRRALVSALNARGYVGIPIHIGSRTGRVLFRSGLEFNHPLVARKEELHAGTLPQTPTVRKLPSPPGYDANLIEETGRQSICAREIKTFKLQFGKTK
jgi:hypothetical protein